MSCRASTTRRRGPKAVRLVLEHRDDYPSEWAAITAVSKRLGMNAETLRQSWIRQRQVDDGQRDGVSSEAAAEIGGAEAPQCRAGADDRNPEGGNVFLRAGERPALTTLTTAQVCAFIADHRDRFRVAPICRVLSEHGVPIAPRTFHAWAVRAPSKRALWDATITEVLAGYYEPDEHGRRKAESLYGSLKMWAHLQREGIPVAKSTVERLMRRHGWQGVRRQKTVRTTIADPTAVRPPDLVDRQFGVPAPNRLLVANALSETTVGSFKNELIRRQGPWRDVNHVELGTAEWVQWFNTERPHEYLDDFTPEAVEKLHYDHRRTPPKAG